MKATAVPAQVTTVEDRIVGNLGMSQIALVTAPIFIGVVIYLVLPPNARGSDYKSILITIISLACFTSAIRVRGEIILLWAILIARYNLRPQYHIYDKNCFAGRGQENKTEDIGNDERAKTNTTDPRTHSQPLLSEKDLDHMRALLENPETGLTFTANKKGGFDVLVTEIKG